MLSMKVQECCAMDLRKIREHVLKLREALWNTPLKECETYDIEATVYALEELVTDIRAFQNKSFRIVMYRKREKERQLSIFDFV